MNILICSLEFVLVNGNLNPSSENGIIEYFVNIGFGATFQSILFLFLLMLYKNYIFHNVLIILNYLS